MKISLGQINIISGNIEENTKKMIQQISKASKSNNDLIIFPEMSDIGYDMNVIIKKATNWREGVVPKLCDAALNNNINVIAGVAKKTEEGVYNAIVVIDRKGNIVHQYFKSHLITAEPMLEHKYLLSGNELDIVEIENVKIGLMTCYEIRFPEIARTLSLKGADIIIIPAAWPLVRLTHWQSLIIARAIENQIFIAGVNRIGNDTGLPFAGTSMLIGPYGNIISSGTQIHETIIEAEISLDEISLVRNQIKVYQDRRPELYNLS